MRKLLPLYFGCASMVGLLIIFSLTLPPGCQGGAYCYAVWTPIDFGESEKATHPFEIASPFAIRVVVQPTPGWRRAVITGITTTLTEQNAPHSVAPITTRPSIAAPQSAYDDPTGDVDIRQCDAHGALFHNATYNVAVSVTWRESDSWSLRPGKTQTHTDNLSMTITVKNMVMTDTTVLTENSTDPPRTLPPPRVFSWDPDNPVYPTFWCHLDNNGSGHCTVTYDIYPVIRSNDTPVRAITHANVNYPGDDSCEWDGKNEDNETLPAGLYTYRITAASRRIQFARWPSFHDIGTNRSGQLTISNVSVRRQSANTAKRVKFGVSYTLSDTGSAAASACKVQAWGRLRDRPGGDPYWAMIGEETGTTLLGRNGPVDMTILRSAVRAIEGELVFVVRASDSHHDRAYVHRAHQTRRAVGLGRGIVVRLPRDTASRGNRNP